MSAASQVCVGIFDDNDLVRSVLRRTLEPLGLTIQEFERADVDGLDLSEMRMVIVDVEMPGDSHAVARIAAEQGVKVVRHSSLDWDQIPLSARGDAYIPKPCRVAHIRYTIQQLLS